MNRPSRQRLARFIHDRDKNRGPGQNRCGLRGMAHAIVRQAWTSDLGQSGIGEGCRQGRRRRIVGMVDSAPPREFFCKRKDEARGGVGKARSFQTLTASRSAPEA